jgi:hypothetical protein
MTPEERLAFAAPFIQASLERSNPSGNTLQEVLTDIVRGGSHLWLGEQSAIVTQPVYSHRVWHGGGDMSDMIEVMQRAWPQMVQHGAQELRIEETRKGWLKQLRPHGFEQVIALVKES